MDGTERLSTFVRAFETDTRGRRRRARRLVAAGLAGLVLVTLGFVAMLLTPGADYVSGAGLLAGVAALPLFLGVVLGYRVPRTETLELWDGGLVQRTDRGTRELPWAGILCADYRSPHPRTGATGSARSGFDVHVVVYPRDGGHVRLTGFTADAAELAEALRRQVPQGYSPNAARHAALGFLGALGFAAVMVGLVVLITR